MLPLSNVVSVRSRLTAVAAMDNPVVRQNVTHFVGIEGIHQTSRRQIVGHLRRCDGQKPGLRTVTDQR